MDVATMLRTRNSVPMVFQRRPFLVAALAAAALLFGPAAARAQADQKLEPVEILLDWKALPTFAGFYLARQMGAFERRGLEVKFPEPHAPVHSPPLTRPPTPN